MVRLAFMEQHNGKEIEQAKDYYRSDYVGIRMFQTGLYVTAAFLVGCLLWTCKNMTSVMKLLNVLNIWGLVWKLCVVYGVLLGAGLLITYVKATKNYFRMQKILQRYKTTLEILEKESDRQ